MEAAARHGWESSWPGGWGNDGGAECEQDSSLVNKVAWSAAGASALLIYLQQYLSVSGL